MTTHLSPAAQAVWDAWSNAYEAQGPLEDMDQPLGAALRAAADQVVPEQWKPSSEYENYPTTAIRFNLQSIRRKLLAIADELEGSNG
jgi:hypothetical protein